MGKINFLSIAGHHLVLDFANFFEVPDSDLIFELLLVEDAEVVVGHNQAAAGN